MAGPDVAHRIMPDAWAGRGILKGGGEVSKPLFGRNGNGSSQMRPNGSAPATRQPPPRAPFDYGFTVASLAASAAGLPLVPLP
ncbi:hypothetical protein OKW43_004742 [Paraburkholderia sp. WC7.3g]